ncbi:MAG: AMP-binding protein [Verrucomicrobiota bacterium JB023]|nr:AMP-binding protein [Verrucomicrobiota bacterium JB023]
MPLTVHSPPHLRETAHLLESQYSTELNGHLFATSGSTGAPKWIHHRQEGLDACADLVNAHFDANSSDKAGLVLPSFHAGGFMAEYRALRAGYETVRYIGKWDPFTFHRFLTAERITLVSLVPTQLHDLVSHGLRGPASLRVALLGGAALPAPLAKQAIALDWPVIASYGMTETAGLVACSPTCSHSASSTLQTLAGWDLRINAEELIEIRGDGLFTGVIEGGRYQKRTNEWHLSSDRGAWHDGALTILGRQDDQLKILGELVNLAQLRNALAISLSPASTTIIAQPDKRRGYRLIPVIEGELTPSLEAVLTSFNENRPGFARLEAARAVPAFPRTALGKIDFPSLRHNLGEGK